MAHIFVWCVMGGKAGEVPQQELVESWDELAREGVDDEPRARPDSRMRRQQRGGGLEVLQELQADVAVVDLRACMPAGVSAWF